MGRGLRRGEIWLASVGGKRRPVVVLTRDAVIDVRALVTVAEITTTARGLSVEVPLDAAEVGLEDGSVVNADGIHTIAHSALSGPVGQVRRDTMRLICRAVRNALAC